MTTAAVAQKSLSPRGWLSAFSAPVFLAGMIFLAAGRWDYWQGWLYLGLTTLVLAVTVYALRHNPELITERLNPGQGMKAWDKLYFAFTTPLYIGFMLLGALDAGRFGWSGELPPIVCVLSSAIYLAGQAIFIWAKATNRFFSSVVRIQTERGHQVCREGPYRFVRHPGYAGSVLWTLASPLVMGSLWALAPCLLSVVALLIRTELEDQTLRRELPGYVDYSGEVKYRLLPGLW